jgi:hypothetical protein
VNFTQTCSPTGNSVTVGPNPVTSQLFVNVTQKEGAKVGIEVVNAIGQKIFSKTYRQEPGTVTEAIPMAGRSKGIYFVRVFVDDKKVFTKQVLR